MSPIRHLILIFVCIANLFLLSGCATTEPIVIYKTVVLAPDDNLLTDCDPAPPPAREVYLAQQPTLGETLATREALQYKMNQAQLSVVAKCNAEKKALRDWKQKATQVLKNSDKTN